MASLMLRALKLLGSLPPMAGNQRSNTGSKNAPGSVHVKGCRWIRYPVPPFCWGRPSSALHSPSPAPRKAQGPPQPPLTLTTMQSPAVLGMLLIVPTSASHSPSPVELSPPAVTAGAGALAPQATQVGVPSLSRVQSGQLHCLGTRCPSHDKARSPPKARASRDRFLM
jgi:hypothetical protein